MLDWLKGLFTVVVTANSPIVVSDLQYKSAKVSIVWNRYLDGENVGYDAEYSDPEVVKEIFNVSTGVVTSNRGVDPGEDDPKFSAEHEDSWMINIHVDADAVPIFFEVSKASVAGVENADSDLYFWLLEHAEDFVLRDISEQY